MFNEKLASIVGPTYVLAFIGGGVKSLTQVPPSKARRTTRLFLNAYINNFGKTASRYANNSAALVFLYLITGKMINFIFLEEFEDHHINETYKNAIYGGLTGAIYKSTRGFRPMMFTSVLGAAMGSGYAYAWQRGFLKLA